MSLRLGASYSATCWALLSNMLVDRPTVNALVNTPPKACKQRALPDFKPESWRRDVWLLSERDRGVQVLGNPNDLLVLVLEEHVSSGYVWDVEPITKAGLQIEKDERQRGRPGQFKVPERGQNDRERHCLLSGADLFASEDAHESRRFMRIALAQGNSWVERARVFSGILEAVRRRAA